IVGTEGSIRISPVPQQNLAVLYNEHGVVTECVDYFGTRFFDAYRLEVEEFVNCLKEGRKPGVTVYDGVNSTKIGFATTKAWKSGEIVKI
ncbi:MAG: Gfo/Idh/MocA family oxidoreductase, partial [Lachnospiraceae bacterium]|nr:Gfo/Idh/MocA family oxidoreductase [Lachnospiraceae bacterium]